MAKNTNNNTNKNETNVSAPKKLDIGTKKIKLLTTLRGSYGTYDAGEVVEIDARLAESFVHVRAAEYVKD